MNLRKLINKDSLYEEYINILNGVLKLSKREVEVLALILKADTNGVGEDINSKLIRIGITKTLGISEPNLSKYLNTFKAKGIIIKENGNWVVNNNIRPIVTSGILELIFTLEIDEGIKKDNDNSTSGMVVSDEF